MMRAFLIALAALCLLHAPAEACAVLKKAEPRVGSTVQGNVDVVTLHFSLRVIPAKSTLKVLAADGHVVSDGKAFGDKQDDKAVSVHVGTLPPGKYKVVWSVLADCGGREPGDFKFTVAE